MSMKYRLLLCVVVLLACTATLFAGTATFYKQTFDPANASKGATDPLNYSKWTFGGNWAVIADVTAKNGIPADAVAGHVATAPAGPAGLVYNKNGDYEPNLSGAYVTTLPISCTGKTSVQLSFDRSLTVEDAQFDKATVAVSNNAGGSWNTVFTNPSQFKSKLTDNTQNLTDPTWVRVSYDISATADNQAAVLIRWGLQTNQNNNNGGSTAVPNLHGWAIDDVTLTAATGDAFYKDAMAGTTFPAGWVATGPIWQMGAPAVGTSGQTRDADGDPATPATVTIGRDPAAMPTGSTNTSLFGTLIGGNYPAGMAAGAGGVNEAPQYLAWGPLDLTGLQKTQLQFQRWLNIGAGNLDRVRVQTHISDSALDNPDDAAVIKDDKTANTINVSSAKVTYAVNTTTYYAQGDGLSNDKFQVTFKYNTNTLAAGEKLQLRYTLDATAGTVVWKSFVGGSITTNTDNSVDSGVVKVTFGPAAFQSAADYVKAQDNAKFAVGAILTKTDDTALDSGSSAVAIISEAKVVGVIWTDLFDNKASSPMKEILDDGADAQAWQATSFDLPAAANGNDAVWVRWSIGPTDSGFTTEYGGWSIADPALVEASREWKFVSESAPKGMQWEKTGAVSVVAKNTGTATWDSKYSLYEAKGVPATITNPGNPTGPSNTLKTVALAAPPSPIARWSVDSIAVSGTVGADGQTTFNATVTAPPLSSAVYATPVIATSAADAALSVLDADWAMANETALGEQDWLPTYRNGSIANAGIVVSRFPDIGLAADGTKQAGYWARFWTEELAGRSPLIVQGFPDGTYSPTVPVNRAQIAVFIARARNFPLTGETGTVFSDVPTGYWTLGAIEQCAANGIVSGYPDRTYDPNGEIKRDAMAKFIVLGAALPLKPAPVAASKADQDTAIANGWFRDVILWNDPATSADDRNPFRDYINTLAKDGIVTGYANTDPADSSKTFFTYLNILGGAPITVDRANLAVFVWRAFMRDAATAVVLGGPAITDVGLVTDGDAPAVAKYYGYSNAGSVFDDGPFAGDPNADPFAKVYKSRLVGSTAEDFAYVTLDAVRLAGSNLAALVGGNGSLDVAFELRRVTGTTGPAAGLTHTESVDALTLGNWITDVLAGNGEPYRNVVWAIPTGLQGDFQLIVSIEGNELGRKPLLSVRNAIFSEGFNDDGALASWTLFGQPQTPGEKIYPVDYIASGDIKTIDDANKDLFLGDGSVELQKTQAIVRQFDTTGRQNIRLGIRYAAVGLGSSESINIEWSYDYGTLGTAAHWKSLDTNLKGTAVPTKLQKDPRYFSIPNGNPNADPKVPGPNDNAAFAVRLSINATSSAKAYFDTLTIDGT